jgi:hypothetical protein
MKNIQPAIQKALNKNGCYRYEGPGPGVFSLVQDSFP